MCPTCGEEPNRILKSICGDCWEKIVTCNSKEHLPNYAGALRKAVEFIRGQYPKFIIEGQVPTAAELESYFLKLVEKESPGNLHLRTNERPAQGG
jgi:hypothetical protein